MPVFRGQGKTILYVHVPKTGGTAVESFFNRNGFDVYFRDTGRLQNLNFVRKCSPQHYNRAILEAIFNFDRFDYIFMTCRDPILRFKSAFLMRASGKPNADQNLWANGVLRKYRADPFVYDNHIRPQSDFYIPGIDVFRQEDGFDEAWAVRLGERIGCDFREPPVRKMVRKEMIGRSAHDVDFDDTVFQKLREFYSNGFILFGY